VADAGLIPVPVQLPGYTDPVVGAGYALGIMADIDQDLTFRTCFSQEDLFLQMVNSGY
jgi:hypothetical protein